METTVLVALNLFFLALFVREAILRTRQSRSNWLRIARESLRCIRREQVVSVQQVAQTIVDSSKHESFRRRTLICLGRLYELRLIRLERATGEELGYCSIRPEGEQFLEMGDEQALKKLYE